MPIKGLSDDVRIPRLGKIHLGKRDPERGFPVKTKYFVFPEGHSDYKKLVDTFGQEPKELRILIPVEDEEQWATQYYKAYDLTHGLICKGDGETATRLVDVDTGELPTNKTKTTTLKEMTCIGKNCPDYKAKKCGETMNLKFILPEIPGIGVWQIDTGSINSILNINSCSRMIKAAFGRISLIPLILSLEPIEVNNPETGKKQTVYVLNMRTNVTLSQLAESAREQSKTLKIQAPDYEAEMKMQVDRDIEELWGEIPSANQRKPDAVEEALGIKPDVIEVKAEPPKTKPPVKVPQNQAVERQDKVKGGLPEFKTMVEVFNYALKNGFTPAKIKELIGTDKPNEVTSDIKTVVTFLGLK